MIKLHEKFIDATSVEEKQAILKMMKTCRIVFCIKTKLNKYFFIRNMLNEDVARDARIINVINNEIDLLEEKMDRIFDDDMLVESKVYQTTTMKPVPMKVEEVYDQVAQEINVRELLKKKIDEEKDEVVKDDKLKIEDLKEVIKRIVEETKNEKKVKETKEEIKGQVKEMKKREMKTNEKVKVLIEKIKKEMKNVEEADIDPILLKKINKLLTQFGEVKEFERRQLNLPQPTHQMMEEIKQRMRTDGVDDTVLPNGRPFTFAEFKEFTNDLNNKIVKGDMEVPEIMKMMKMKNQRH
ncbi:hypothetical protein SNEBB_001544 [Seison nebaliae]|nr:hypothetical protein SNEBB_001544 [Seison nebaliae]